MLKPWARKPVHLVIICADELYPCVCLSGSADMFKLPGSLMSTDLSLKFSSYCYCLSEMSLAQA